MVLSIPRKLFVLLVLAGLLLAACGTSNSNIPATPVNPDLENALPPNVALNIQNQISQTLGVAVKDIQIRKVEQMDWPNACLGLPQGNEACAQVVTPGWLLTFNINGQAYNYRIDKTGTVIRQELIRQEP
jgi:hypothetical protein